MTCHRTSPYAFSAFGDSLLILGIGSGIGSGIVKRFKDPALVNKSVLKFPTLIDLSSMCVVVVYFNNVDSMVYQLDI